MVIHPDFTPLLGLPYLLSNQAQKHVTLNEALRALDSLIHISVAGLDASTPPSAPEDGMRYILSAAPDGAWTGQAKALAFFTDGEWFFKTPQKGWTAFVETDGRYVVFDGTDWTPLNAIEAGADIGGHEIWHAGNLATGADDRSFGRLGISANGDATNRLIVKSPASLFDHTGTGGHQVKLNKKEEGDSTGFLFQSDYSGRAEFGLIGDDKFRLKVSADGSSWKDALEVNGATGSAKFIEPPELPQYSRAHLPSPSISARIIYIWDATGGAGPAYADGGSWKMMRNDGAP